MSIKSQAAEGRSEAIEISVMGRELGGDGPGGRDVGGFGRRLC